MFDKLSFIEERFAELEHKISDPEVIADQELWRKLCKEHSDITPIVEKYREYKALNENIEEAKEMLADSSLDKDEKSMIEDEISASKKQIEDVSEEIKILLLPKDPNDDKNVIIEIRGGTGGDEAALFAADLLRMYSMYAETRRWRVEILSSNETDIGGYKEVTFSINGDMAYSRLKFESGVHRVQRIPSTESGGRIHTSAATVAVLQRLRMLRLRLTRMI